MSEYTDVQLQKIVRWRDSGLTWRQVAQEFNNEFNPDIPKSEDSIRKVYKRSKLVAEIGHEETDIKLFQHNRVVRATNYRLRKEANVALDVLNTREALIEELNKALSHWKFPKPKIETPKQIKSGKLAVIEGLISDLHIGQKTESYNFDIAKARLIEYRNVFLHELTQAKAKYNIDSVVLALLGDIISSFEFHGLQSAVVSESVTPPQVVNAIQFIFDEVIRPIAEKGYKVVIPAICGNHDRVLKDKPMNVPGRESVTYIIYHMLRMLCRISGYHNVEMVIPDAGYCVLPILGFNVLFEHGDKSLKPDHKSAEAKINDRQTQQGKVIHFARFGHFHKYLQIDRGRIIFNGSTVTDDGYANELGLYSDAGQTISLYVESSKRCTPFYWSYLVSLSQIK